MGIANRCIVNGEWNNYVQSSSMAIMYRSTITSKQIYKVDGKRPLKMEWRPKTDRQELLRSLENGVRFGRWVLLENIFESLDAALEPILQEMFLNRRSRYDENWNNNVPYNDASISLQRNYLTPIMRLRHA